MAAPISMEGFRSLERHEQVRALGDAEFLGMAVTKHYAAHYYCISDFFVALCTTRCGLDFSLVFRDGNDYHDMVWAIDLAGLPRNVKPLRKKEREAAMLEDLKAAYGSRPKQTLEELARTLGIGELAIRVEAAKLSGTQMEVFRSFTRQEQSFLTVDYPVIASGGSAHFNAHYVRIDDFYHAHGTTTDGVDFALTFRDGRALSWLRKAEQQG